MKKRAEFDKVYEKRLVDANWNEIVGVDDYQAAFLDLLNELYPSLLKRIQKPLEERFYEMYKNSPDQNERNYKVKDELALYEIQVPSKSSDDWQLMYEMKSDDTIFHVEFEGWTYNSIGITH